MRDEQQSFWNYGREWNIRLVEVSLTNIKFQPIIAMFGNLQTSVPVYTSGALFIAAGLAVIALPYEPQGKASL